MTSFADKIKKHKFPTVDVRICVDQSLSLQRDEAMAELSSAIRSDAETRKNAANILPATVKASKKRVEAAQKAVADLEDEMRDSSVTLRVSGVNYATYNGFIAKNPPRPKKNESVNADTFYLYVAERTTVYVHDDGTTEALSAEDWKSLRDVLTEGEHERIAAAVLEVNRARGRQDLDFLSRNSAQTPDSAETSDSPASSA